MKFTKMQAFGNDYVYIDAIHQHLDNLPEPDVLASDIIENLQSALESFQELKSQIGK